MIDDLDITDFGEDQMCGVGAQTDPILPLGIGQTVVPIATLEARIPWRLTPL